jgi:sphinganine-1-phosphate aldolase
LILLGNYKWKEGFTSGIVYNYDEDTIKLIAEVYGKSSFTNPLHPEVFPGICKMEAEVIRMIANLFNGGPDACGTMTTGGTGINSITLLSITINIPSDFVILTIL